MCFLVYPFYGSLFYFKKKKKEAYLRDKSLDFTMRWTKRIQNILLLWLFLSYYDVSFVQFYSHSEFLLNLVVKSMLGKFKGQTKACNKSTGNTRNTYFSGFLAEM